MDEKRYRKQKKNIYIYISLIRVVKKNISIKEVIDSVTSDRIE